MKPKARVASFAFAALSPSMATVMSKQEPTTTSRAALASVMQSGYPIYADKTTTNKPKTKPALLRVACSPCQLSNEPEPHLPRVVRGEVPRTNTSPAGAFPRTTRGDRRIAASHVSWYSGPSPPSGSVNRPPLAVIAPHWTQLEAVTWTSTSVAPLRSWSSGIS